MRMTRNHADAEDLLQDTMVKACVSLRSRKHNTNLGGWLFRIMTNTYTDMYRKQRRHPVHYTTRFTAEVAGADHSAEDQALNMLGHSGIRAAMRALPEQFRLAVYYADVEGFGYREIADLMQTPVGTVTSRVHRGRACGSSLPTSPSNVDTPRLPDRRGPQTSAPSQKLWR
jgi:RNA polymerase sigma-70 factor (ECF subfamily)